MARTQHSTTRRHVGKRIGVEGANRSRLRQQMSLGQYDELATHMPTRVMRTSVTE